MYIFRLKFLAICGTVFFDRSVKCREGRLSKVGLFSRVFSKGYSPVALKIYSSIRDMERARAIFCDFPLISINFLF